MNGFNGVGLRHGEWEEYHPDGSLSWKGSFYNGELHGSFKSYFENGDLNWVGKFNMGLPSGCYMEYDIDKIINIKEFHL